MKKKDIEDCKWCESSIKFGIGPIDRPDWKRWHCNKCGSFGYINNPSIEELSNVYQSAWGDSDDNGDFAAGSTSRKIANSLLDIVNWSPTQNNCLDYGGGKGNFTISLIQRGAKNITVFEPFGKNPGLQYVNWVNNMNQLGSELFEWIFMIEVIEHLLDPQEELEKVRKHLLPGGKLVITTPNAKGWRARMDGFKWREVQNPTHINLFSEKTLKTILLESGFSSAKRILRPVKYNAQGFKSVALSVTQMIGIDGGLRFIAVN